MKRREELETDQLAGKKITRIKHYSSRHKILLVGEGDFSFAACLAKVFEDASNMVATSLDSRDKLISKYSNAKSNLKVLEEKGCTILFEVDAHTMNRRRGLRHQKFDRIVFNFPHAGQLWLFREHNALQIKLHQDLVRGFLKSARKLLAENAEVHITHKTAHPFDRWNIEELASDANLYLVDKVSFSLCDYPGYCNKRGEGHGSRCNGSFPIGECSTFKFGKVTNRRIGGRFGSQFPEQPGF